MAVTAQRQKQRGKRRLRVRKRIMGTPQRPRLCVFRSLRHTYAQLIDDAAGRTLVSAATTEPSVREKLSSSATCDGAAVVGTMVAQRALEKGITKVVFDRSGYLYHGRVKAVAEAAREAGLEF